MFLSVITYVTYRTKTCLRACLKYVDSAHSAEGLGYPSVHYILPYRIQVGTWRIYIVAFTSMQRHAINATLYKRDIPAKVNL